MSETKVKNKKKCPHCGEIIPKTTNRDWTEFKNEIIEQMIWKGRIKKKDVYAEMKRRGVINGHERATFYQFKKSWKKAGKPIKELDGYLYWVGDSQ